MPTFHGTSCLQGRWGLGPGVRLVDSYSLLSSNILEVSGLISKPPLSLVAGLLFSLVPRGVPCPSQGWGEQPAGLSCPAPGAEVVLLPLPCSCCGLCTRRMPSPKVSWSSAAVPSEPLRDGEVSGRPGPASSSEVGGLLNRVKTPSPMLMQTLFPRGAFFSHTEPVSFCLGVCLRRKKQGSYLRDVYRTRAFN